MLLRRSMNQLLTVEHQPIIGTAVLYLVTLYSITSALVHPCHTVIGTAVPLVPLGSRRGMCFVFLGTCWNGATLERLGRGRRKGGVEVEALCC